MSPLIERGLIAVCAMVEMEILVGARNEGDHDDVREWFRGFERLHVPDDVWDRAVVIQRGLVHNSNHRSVKLPDLLIAAIAERHGVTVLHYDKDFDRIAEVTGQPTEWVVPPGSAD
jgi:predicted nucleic acid-binding protein